MAGSGARSKHKHFILDQAKIERAQKLLGTQTETETIERALDEVIAERERNRQAWAAHERFIKSGIEVRDIYGVLAESK
jgi:hypothetical protein